jgi:hypothetical protein
VLTIDPPPARSIDGATVFMPRNTPLTLIRMTRSNSASSTFSSEPNDSTPALFTSTLIGPNRASVSSTTDRQLASSVTSRWV